MKKKINVLIISMLLCFSTVLVVNKDLEVEATPGGGGGNGDDSNFLNNSYIWDRLKNFTNVIYDAYGPSDIPKGRSYGTKGGDYTVKNILIPKMNAIDLEDIHTEQIKHIPGINKNYTTIINKSDFQLTINNASDKTYEFPNPVPIQELGVIASGFPPLTVNHSLSNVEIKVHNMTTVWPFGGLFGDYYINITNYNALNCILPIIVGNITYIGADEQIPEDQYGRIFLLDDTDGCQEKLDDISSGLGSIIIDSSGTKGTQYVNASKANVTVVNISSSDGTTIKELLENYSVVIADNVTGNLTLTYNLNNSGNPYKGGFNPSCDFVFIDRIPDHYELQNETGKLFNLVLSQGIPPDQRAYNTCFFLKSAFWYWWNDYSPIYDCKGFILYDKFEHHFLLETGCNWSKEVDVVEWVRDLLDEFSGGPIGEVLLSQIYMALMQLIAYCPGVPIFTLNNSVGKFLRDNSDTTTVSGYLNQTFLKETPNNPAIEAYNVIGNITIDESPDDAVAIISNRYDGMWGQTPGDSGVGGAIVLGIAKYMKDYNIKPKYNLTFLFTTGEEYGFRGAWHYNDSHPEDNIKYWIGLDQLCFDQSDSELCIYHRNENHGDIINASINATKYYYRSGYENKTFHGNGAGSEQGVYSTRENCDTFMFVKPEHYDWDRWHRAGMNYTEGDSLKYIDQNDVNITAELVWNITKYFTVNPDCWIESKSFNTCDSDDVDNLKDTVTVDFDVKSILPHDLNMVKLTLIRFPLLPIMSKYMNFSVNRSATSKSINITLPEDKLAGFYRCRIDLYNSTGRINKIIGLSGDNINQTKLSDLFFLHPYNYSKTPPKITNVTDSPDPVGYGFNVTINADVTSNVTSVDMVTVNISFPDDTLKNYNMSNTVGDTYEYVFSDTWQYGQYDYVIWANDSYGVENGSSQYSFNVPVNATISVCTIKDSYGGGEIVNLTDPPGNIGSSQQIGYELLDNGEVLNIWNKFDNYYFNTSNGIQFTNHYNEYWSHNVLMLGYYNNDVWNLIYRSDELNGFNKDIESDNETFVNTTLWKDLTYSGYDFRLAIRYHLGVDDNELTVIPYIKNIDDEDIPYVLGFAWEIKDIQIGMTTGGDYIDINGTTYFLNEEDLDETYKNIITPCFYIREDISNDESESLYLRWDENLNYVVRVKSRDGQYNAPVTLGIKIGTLSVGQEKYTSLFWHDAYEKVYYFDDYEDGGPREWALNPSYMVDNNISTYASTATNYDLERCNNNTCTGTDLGTITKVEIRCRGYHADLMSQADIILRPVFNNKDGGDHTFVTSTSSSWSEWFDITTDPNAPQGWDWNDVEGLFCDVIAERDPTSPPPPSFILYCSKVEMRVTYNIGPVVSNPYPANGSTGVSIAPMLSVYVYDADNDLMNISWSSNSSGSWQDFGSNSSVQIGTYYQTMDNASVNGQWWYWRVNVSDGTNYTLSDVFKFYTGEKSMIENTGSTNFSGYLLMRIDYYNNSSSSWIVEQVVVNETTPRVINVDSVLALDTIFNAQSVNTTNFQNGNGTYRVYAAFRDPNGNVLQTEGGGSTMGGYLAAVYEFTVTFD